jgi:antitoxin YefM
LHFNKINSTIILYVIDEMRFMNISYSELRQNLKATIDTAASKHEPFFITSHKKRKAVILAYEDYESLEETAYLLKHPKMAKRLLEAVSDVKEGKTIPHDLIDET